MRAAGTDSFRDLAIVGVLLGLVAVPVACAQGSVLSNVGPSGAGGHTTSSTITVGTVTVGTGGFGGAGGGFGGGSSTGDTGGSCASVSSTTVSSSSGGPSSMCDMGGCDECSQCANCSICVSQAAECEEDPDCFDILFCLECCAPSDTVCEQECITSDPAGEPLFNAYNDCLGCACQESCQVPAGDCP
jgi:hypothetical protein